MHHVEKQSVKCFVATISDTRTTDTDISGQLIKQLLEKEQHEVVGHQIIKDDKVLIGQMIDKINERTDVEVILLTGGTGISMRDVTIEVVENKLTKTIPGFGELFRMLSYTEDIGSAAMMSRAVAGVLSNGQLIFSMPGSSGAVKLAMNKLILPEVSHMIYELRKQK
ncbi:MAG TPA: MogA/MoaB family molybdenum cofactor biosynthesis protein [Pseudogracilibacillus sp.]|nr:MogA/MoaB family molybdenum cofactor biosynthesis protein [Pseudogracilibacillus sp.]